MNLKKININAFSLGLTFTLMCSGCAFEEQQKEEGISYQDLVNDYRMLEFEYEDKSVIHFLKKQHIEESCYGYYEIVNNKCVIKVDEENGSIINHSAIVIKGLTEHSMKEYLNKYNINMLQFTDEELNTIVEMIKTDYEKEKVLVK